MKDTIIRDESPEVVQIEHMTYGELRQRFRDHERSYPRDHLTANIVFTEDGFTTPYSLTERTYTVSSDNKAYQPNKSGYSIYGSCADGTDAMVRLEQYMAAELGGKDGWKVDYCYMASNIDSTSDHIRIDGHIGTWYVIDEGKYRAPTARRPIRCLLLEHETYGDEAAHIIVNSAGVVLLDDVYNGFDDLLEVGWMQETD